MATVGISLAFLSLLVLTSVTVQVVFADCPLPPAFWCSDVTVAKKCGVLAQCEKFAETSYNQPLQVTLYYESLCPDCVDFFKEQLFPIYNTLPAIANISLVPYGNAYEHWDSNLQRFVYSCQHGDSECRGNIIETCAIELLAEYFPFVYCMEQSHTDPVHAAKECGSRLGVDVKPILECAASVRGNTLEHQMALKTEALEPQHTSVPWLTINGVHTDSIQDLTDNGLAAFLCQNYVGSNLPAACYGNDEDSDNDDDSDDNDDESNDDSDGED